MKKTIHFILMAVSFVTGVTGIVFAFLSHNLKKPDPFPNLYSPHSFVGLFTAIIYFCQLTMGFLGFIINDNDTKKLAYATLHRPMGVTAFLLGIGAILMGLQEKAAFLYDDDNKH